MSIEAEIRDIVEEEVSKSVDEKVSEYLDENLGNHLSETDMSDEIEVNVENYLTSPRNRAIIKRALKPIILEIVEEQNAASV